MKTFDPATRHQVASLQARMGLVLLAFLLLLSASAAATFWALESQKQDALLVNLAGRQRMLVQQMALAASRVVARPDDAAAHRLTLQEAARAFDDTLQILIHGGQLAAQLPDGTPSRSVAVPAASQPAIRAGLRQVEATRQRLAGYLEVIGASAPESQVTTALAGVERLAPELADQADQVVGLYQAAAEQKLARLRWLQIAFFGAAIALLALDLWLMGRFITRPLRVLGAAAEQIGRGDLTTPVEAAGPQEIVRLTGSLEIMRAQLLAARDAESAWTAELEARVAQRTRELDALHEVSRDISSRLEIHQVLQSVTDKARELLCGNVAVLCLLDDAGAALHLRSVSGPQEAIVGAHCPAQRGPADRVLAGDRALPCGSDACNGCCTILGAPFKVTHLVAPLRVGQRVIGALCVGGIDAQSAGSGTAIHLLTEMANSAAIALENARLYAQAERLAALEERQRLAGEMHDGLAQTLSYLGLKTDQASSLLVAGQDDRAAQELQLLRAAIDQASDEVRRSIADLQVSAPPDQVLHERLAATVEAFAKEGDPPVQLVVDRQASVVLPAEQSDQVLKVVREALLNARRHAQASQVTVRLQTEGPEVHLVVEDDGRGFDPAAVSGNGSGHFGLSLMRARASRVDGVLDLHSRPGYGTRVVLRWAPDRPPSQEVP